MSKQWIESGNNVYFNEIPTIQGNKLPFGIYELAWDDHQHQFFLKKISDSFHLPKKMYGVHNHLVERVCTTFQRLEKNFGVLFKGTKGTGKTVAGKEICNRLQIPVILINQVWEDMGEFINSIDQEVCLFFDEFEKIYSFYSREDDENGRQASVHRLLTLMDGVFTAKQKRLFMLTTNEVYLPDPLQSRPSRIRYIYEFEDLSYDQIMEILDDTLEDKSHVKNILEVISESEFITVDLVKEMATECNIYGDSSHEFFNMFNIKKKDNYYEVVEVVSNGTENVVQKDFKNSIYDYGVGYNFHFKGMLFVGRIVRINEESGEIIVVDRNDENEQPKEYKYRIQKTKFVHKSMVI